MTISKLRTIDDDQELIRFWQPSTLRLPYPKMNASALAEVMGVTVSAVLQRCLRGAMPFPVTFEDDRWYADRTDVERWYQIREEGKKYLRRIRKNAKASR